MDFAIYFEVGAETAIWWINMNVSEKPTAFIAHLEQGSRNFHYKVNALHSRRQKSPYLELRETNSNCDVIPEAR
jgi:hypothetical protein